MPSVSRALASNVGEDSPSLWLDLHPGVCGTISDHPWREVGVEKGNPSNNGVSTEEAEEGSRAEDDAEPQCPSTMSHFT